MSYPDRYSQYGLNSRYSQYGQSRIIGTLMAATPAGELFLAVVLVLIVLVFFFTLEGLYSAFTYSKQKMTPLMNYTASSTERTLAVHQDPTKYQDAIPILFSDNEPTGTEFAYSFYLYVNPSTFTNSAVLYHVWHKGFGCVWPLMGPGVFIRGETNTMRIVMNTFANPYTIVDVANIPVKKWFHVVLNCRRSGLEVHVNGNLANKIRFENTMAYQNFQDIVLFSNANYRLGGSTTGAIGEDTFRVAGVFQGMMSSFMYARYALSYGEIQALMNAGPSTTMKTDTAIVPPYMNDSWWTTSYNT